MAILSEAKRSHAKERRAPTFKASRGESLFTWEGDAAAINKMSAEFGANEIGMTNHNNYDVAAHAR